MKVRYRFPFPHLPKINWRSVLRNAAWFGAGVLSTTAFVAIAAVTVIDQALDNIQVSSRYPGPLWVKWDNVVVNMFADAECWWMTDAELTTDRVQQDWAPLRNFLAKSIAKFGVTPLTAEQRAFCGLPALPAKPTYSPDGTSIGVGGSLVTAEGTWTFGTATASGGNAILLNGAQASGGFGKALQTIGGEIYTFTADQRWFHWMRPGWTVVSAPPVVAPPVVTPPAPATSFTVKASGTAPTRPLYDDAGKQIGTVAIGTKCEDAVVRKTTVEYHYTTNAAGLRGQAVCQ